MSSYALLSALSGFRYSAATKTLWIGPMIDRRSFRCFFSTAGGYGVFTLARRNLTIEMTDGRLEADRVVLPRDGRTRIIQTKVDARTGKPWTLRNITGRADTRLETAQRSGRRAALRLPRGKNRKCDREEERP